MMFAATLVTVASCSSATFLIAATAGAVKRFLLLISIVSHDLGLGPGFFLWSKKYEFMNTTNYFNLALFVIHHLQVSFFSILSL